VKEPVIKSDLMGKGFRKKSIVLERCLRKKSKKGNESIRKVPFARGMEVEDGGQLPNRLALLPWGGLLMVKEGGSKRSHPFCPARRQGPIRGGIISTHYEEAVEPYRPLEAGK